jgi:selenocysteine lyase/cysteine desulfurase
MECNGIYASIDLLVLRGLGQGFHSEFIWMGTMDYCPWLSARVALKFFAWLDYDKVHKYNTDLIQWATNMLTTVWNTETLVPLQMCQYMAVVHVPDSKEACSGEDSCQMSNLHDELLKEHQIEVPIFTFKGKRWARISAHVYNTKNDFIRFAQAVITTQRLGEEAQHKLNSFPDAQK